MRPIDNYLALYESPDPELKRFALDQIGGVRVDSEAEDLVRLLSQAPLREDGILVAQARRSLRAIYPRYQAYRYQQRQAAIHSAAGTWTEYNIDRSQIENLKRLGLAQSQDYSTTPNEDFILSALHLLDPLIQIVIGKLDQANESVVLEAAWALGFHPYAVGAQELARAASRNPQLCQVAAAALAEGQSSLGHQTLLNLVGTASQDGELADLLMELGAFDSPRTLDRLKAHSGHASERVRASVAAALGRQSDPESIDLLTRLIKDSDRNVILFSLASLRNVGNPDVLDKIIGVFDGYDDSLVRQEAIRTIVRISSESARDFLSSRINHSDHEVRSLIVEGLIRLDLPEKELFKLVFPLIQDPHPRVVANAVLALAPIDSGMASGRIHSLLGDAQAATRTEGAWCLGYVQSPSSLNMLRQAVFYDSDESVILTAVRSLGKYGDESAVEALLSVMKHQNPRVRQTAARKLGEATDSDVRRKTFGRLGEILKTETDEKCRASIFQALARLGDPSQYLIISTGLKESSREVVEACIEGLDLMGTLDGISHIAKFLDDSRPSIKARAAAAMWHQGEVKLIPRLTKMLESQDGYQVVGALRSVSEMLLSVRALTNESKFIMLLSELRSNLKSSSFKEFKAGLENQDSRIVTTESRHVESFEFQTVIADQTDDFPAPKTTRAPAPAAEISSPEGIPGQQESQETPQVVSPKNPTLPLHVPATSSDPLEIRPNPDVRPQPPAEAPVWARQPALDDSETSLDPATENFDIFGGSGRFTALSFEPEETADPEESRIENASVEVRIEEAIQAVGAGRLADAVRILEGTATTAPAFAQFARCTLFLTQFHRQGKDSKDDRRRAILALEKTISEDRTAVEPRLALAQLTQEAGDAGSTYRLFLGAAEVALSHLATEIRNANELLKDQGPGAVGPVVRELNRHLPHIGQMMALQGEIAYRSGRLDEAFTHLYKARLFDPANRPLAYLLARISQKLGKIALCRHLLMGLIEARDTPQDLLQKAKNLLQKI